MVHIVKDLSRIFVGDKTVEQLMSELSPELSDWQRWKFKQRYIQLAYWQRKKLGVSHRGLNKPKRRRYRKDRSKLYHILNECGKRMPMLPSQRDAVAASVTAEFRK